MPECVGCLLPKSVKKKERIPYMRVLRGKVLFVRDLFDRNDHQRGKATMKPGKRQSSQEFHLTWRLAAEYTSPFSKLFSVVLRHQAQRHPFLEKPQSGKQQLTHQNWKCIPKPWRAQLHERVLDSSTNLQHEKNEN